MNTIGKQIDDANALMRRLHLTDFKIHELNGEITVDVFEDVVIRGLDLIDGRFPINFGVVDGNFYCQSPLLTSLKGSPTAILKSFNINNTGVTSLEDGPSRVDNDYHCVNTQITNLEGAPKSVYYFNASKCKNLVSFKGCPTSVDLSLNVSQSGIKSFDDLKVDYINALIINDTKIKSFEGLQEHLPRCHKITTSFEKIKKGGLSLLMIDSLDQLVGANKVPPFQIILKYLGHPDKIFECQNELIDNGFDAFANP